MSWVWEHSRAEGTDRLVLLAIADCASDDGGNAWPSVETIADKAKVSERTVQRSVKALRLLGEIDVTPNAGKRGANLYTVKMSPPADSHPDNLTPDSESPRQPDGVTACPDGVTPVTPGGDTRVTRTVKNHQNRPLSSDEPLKSTTDPRFVEFWRTYPRHEGKPNALKALAKALRRAPLETILAGAQRYRDDPNREDGYTAHPATWLNRDGWDDDPLPPRSTSPARASASTRPAVPEW